MFNELTVLKMLKVLFRTDVVMKLVLY